MSFNYEDIYKANRKWNFEDDILQDALVAYLEATSAGKYIDDNPLKIIWGIARNKRNSEYKSETKKTQIVNDFEYYYTSNKNEMFVDEADALLIKEEDEIIAFIRANQIIKLINDNLSDTHQTILRLYVFNNETTLQSLADSLNMSKSRVYRYLTSTYAFIQKRFCVDIKKNIKKLKKK